MARDADRIRAEVFRLASDGAWLDKIGSDPFRYADGGYNPFFVKFVELNGPEALAELAARTSDSELRKRWLKAIRSPVERDAKGRFVKKPRG